MRCQSGALCRELFGIGCLPLPEVDTAPQATDYP